MSIELKITGADASELAQAVVGLAFTFAPNLRDRVSAATAPVAEAETVEPPKQPARRSTKKAQTIDAEANKENEDAVQSAGDGPDSAGTGDVGGGEPEPVATDESAAAETVAEKAADAKPSMTVDELRKRTTVDYLGACFATQAERSEAYKALLDEFGVAKIIEVPADKIDAFAARVDELIAEKAKS